MKMEQTECSETSAYKIQMSGNYPEESIQHSEHGEILKARKVNLYEGCSESKNIYTYNLRICFIVPDQSCGVFSSV